MNKSKISAFLSILAVFASGLVLGAFGYRLYSAPPVSTIGVTSPPPPHLSPEELRKKLVAEMTSKIKLDADQVKQLNVIMDQIQDEFEQLGLKMKPDRDGLNEQRKAVEERRKAIADKWKPERDAIEARQYEKVRAMLREDQRPLYEAWHVERDRQRKLRDQRKKQ